ncbi:MAG: transporter substrate-binding domain-containing protein [Geminicoccaceae bacterium]
MRPAALCQVLVGLATMTLLGGTAIPTAGAVETVRLRADAYCPVNCEPSSDRPGYAVEIARTVFGAAGLEVDYALLSWARSIAETRAGRYSGVIGAAATEVPDFVLSQPIGSGELGMAVRRGEHFDFNDPERFDRRLMAVIDGYAYDEGALDAYILSNTGRPEVITSVSSPTALADNLRKLAASRVDLVPDDANVLRHNIHQLGLDDVLEVITDGHYSPIYIAFSPADPMARTLAQILDRGLDELRQSGQLATLLERYGLADWN